MADDGQVGSNAAEVHDEFFLPTLFRPWAAKLASTAELRSGERVLDVACGTGVLTLEAARRVTPGGEAVGVDINPGMLAVARRKAPETTWHEAPAEGLPFDPEALGQLLQRAGIEDQLVAEAERELAGFVANDGSVCFAHSALVVAAQRPAA